MYTKWRAYIYIRSAASVGSAFGNCNVFNSQICLIRFSRSCTLNDYAIQIAQIEFTTLIFSSQGCRPFLFLNNLDGPNRQSPIGSVQRTWSTLAGHSAGPRGTNTTPTKANRVIRTVVQRTQGLHSPLRERSECQRTLVIRITAITLASNAAITLAQFRPSKVNNGFSSQWVWLRSRIASNIIQIAAV